MGMQGSVRNWRKDLREIIEYLRKDGVTQFKWSSANDEHVCSKCKSRDGKIFTYKEILNELNGAFCKPSDPDDRCRCTIIAADGVR
ncbi:MAG: hypothetical protein JXA16_12480 [Bacteroidales bacterium]|nr:hypothetical protein [Bacteroidales bacterium]